MTIHLHKASGLNFVCGELMSYPDGSGQRETFGMTVITLQQLPDEPVLVGCYFGEYDEALTDHCIDLWIIQQSMDDAFLELVHNCADIIEAYRLTNEGYMEVNHEQKVADTLYKLRDIQRQYFT